MTALRNLFNFYSGSGGHCVARIPRLHFFIAILFSVIAAQASTVNCSNNTGDAGAIQSAVNSGGTVTINGTCALGTATVTIANAVSITGSATLNGTGSVIFSIWSNNVLINGLTFNGTTAASVNGSDGSVNQYFTFTNNTVQNTNGNDGVELGPIMQYAAINNNKFYNIAPNGFSSFIFNGACYSSGAGCDLSGTGIGGLNGWDNSTIQYNTFDLIANDGIHIAWNDISQDRFYFLTSNVSVSYNTFTRVHRIALEAQGTTNWTGCSAGTTNVPSNCTDGNHIYCSSFKVAGNYAHNFFQTYVNTYAFSLPTTNDQQYINNSGIAENPNVTNNSSLAYAQETAGHNSLIQGNVYASDYFNPQNPHGWSNGILFGGSSPLGGLATVQNNYLCMDQESTTDFNQENPVGDPYQATVQYNFRANSCPNAGHLATSSITPSFISSSSANGSMTFNFGVVSTLSIQNVQFFLDSAPTPVSTQEISDVSTTFANDTKWLYHVNLNTSSLASGSHNLVAMVTDVSGASQSLSKSFSVAGTGTPAAQLNPTSIAFGSLTVGVASSAQNLTLTNSGTASLSINGISLTGSNPTDFAETSNCGATLAASASCTITLVFTPSVAAQETASVSVADNASGSPQTVSLSGTGVAPAPAPTPTPTPTPTPVSTPSPLPTNLPKGMILWLANNAGVVASGSSVSVWEDQSGNANNAAQSTKANMPTLVNGDNGQSALHFNGTSTSMSISSLPINGLTGMTVFLVSASSGDVAAGYGAYAFLNWPETAYWGQTFFATYQSFSEFRFGTTQVGNENNVPMAFNRTSSFGLNEWLHSGTTDSMFLNGHSVTSINGKSTPISGVGNAALLGQNGTTYYPGDVSEVIVYNRALNTAERQTVEQYLMAKYHL